jgi:hypothetical protein
LREIPICRAFCISLKSLIKIPVISRPYGRSTPPCSPLAGPLWKQTPISEPCSTYLLDYPVKEPSLKFPFMESLTERCPVPRALLYSSFKGSPGIQALPPDSMFPSVVKGPLWTEMPVSRDFLNVSYRVPSEGAHPHPP